jgi:UV DNA damage endonuclease
VLALAERIGRPVVWDILHHHCNDPDGIPDREALATWPDGVRPKIPYSSPRTGSRRCALTPTWSTRSGGLDVDVMLEAKAKDLALLRPREHLAARGVDVG